MATVLDIPRLTVMGEELENVELLDDCTPLLDDVAALRHQAPS